MRLPVVALVGRPNVGKSTLFNQLTRSRDALVADEAGLTRDRQYGRAKVAGSQCLIVDTGGIMEAAEGLDQAVREQSRLAIEEADRVLLMVDGRSGVMAEDFTVAEMLRPHHAKTQLVINKCEGQDPAFLAADFYQLGFGEPLAIAAAHAQGLAAVREDLAAHLDLGDQDEDTRDHRIKVAFVGRPNVGKSTLVNRLLGEERVVASDVAGTTRDSVEVAFTQDGRDYLLIDTAGLRRRAKVSGTVEKFSVIKTLQAVERSNVVVAMIDGREEVGSQDARILGMITEAGRAVVIAINKWDGLAQEQRDWIRSELDRKLPFLDYARIVTISALHGSGLRELMQAVRHAHRASFMDLPAGKLTAVLEQAVQAHQPPAVAGRRIKLRYAHQGGRNPPTIVIHGNQTDKLDASYRRYLSNVFRDAFQLRGTPIVLQFRTGDNPYKDRKNTLSERQFRRRQRMIRHRKGR